MRFQVDAIPLDGTNPQDYVLSVPAVSLTFFADTTSITLQVRPSRQSAYAPLTQGRSLSLSETGRLIDPTIITLTAASAVTAYVIAAFP